MGEQPEKLELTPADKSLFTWAVVGATWTGVLGGIAGAVLLILIVNSVRSRAHSHYPAECCSDTDCWAMGEDADAREKLPQETPEGWVLFDGSLVASNEARRSPDGRYHVCRQQAKPDGQVIQPQGRPKCFWAPAPSF